MKEFPSELSRLLREFPPVLCRILAKDGQQPRSAERIAKLSSLSAETVKRVSLLPSWQSVPVAVAVAFMHGCGVDILKARRLRHLIRRGNYGHLARLPHNRFTYYRKLFTILTKAHGH